jgi:peptidylprolyl isomerase
MRRAVFIVTFAALTLVACGGSDSTDSSVPPGGTASGSSPAATESSTPNGTEVTPPASSGIPTDSVPGETLPPNPDKPSVELPEELPTELVRTVLEPGAGDAAVAGDTVIVDYVGVRSVDGVEFDNSYDREPLPVTLGTGGVIPGWEEGLVGALTGERVQLDIPADLAYGDEARGDIIREKETLSFVIDVRVVVKAVDPADVPTEPGVALSEGATETTFEDLIVGEGATLEDGETAVLRYINFRGDNGVALETAWGADPIQIVYGENLLPGLLKGLDGINVGGRRAITIPPADGFGEEGNPQGGLPVGTDMIFLVELLGTY